MPPGPKSVPAGTKKKHKFVAKAQRGTLAVTVKDGKGTAISGAAVQVEQPGGKKLKGQTTGTGTVSFPSVVAGQCKITVTKAGFDPGAGAVKVSANTSVATNVVLQPTTPTLVVTVIDSQGTALVDAEVTVDNPPGAKITQKTDAKGQATVKALTVGTHQVSAALDNYTSPAAKAVQVAVKGKNTAIVTLKPNAVVAELSPAPLVVVVKKHGCNPARQKLTLKTTGAPFTGTGTGAFTCSKTNVDFFKAPAGGTKIEFKNNDNVFTAAELSNGIVLFAEGTAASKALEDIKLTLTLSVGANKLTHGTVKATTVELTLDVCQTRTAPGKQPNPVKAKDKIDVGRFLQLQDPPQNNAHRAMLIVRRAAPADFAGALRLARLNGNVKLFDVETGGADHATPQVLAKADIPNDGKVYWIEGATASAALRDAGLQLGIDGLENDGDEVKVTVVSFTQMQATIHGTPAGHAGFAPADHVFKHTSLSGDKAVNIPLVLIRNSQPDVALQVDTSIAGLPIRWQAIRFTDDHATIGKAGKVPIVTPAVNLNQAALSCNERGSFHVRAYIDCNGSNTYQSEEPSMALNLVLVDVRLVADRSVHNSGFLSAAFDVPAAPTSFGVSNGNWAAGQAAMNMDADFDAIGGGAAGTDGLASAFAGLVNNLALVDIRATYVDGGGASHDLINLYVSNVPATMVLGKPGFRPGGAVPNPLTWPVLDSGRPGNGKGGDTATMTSSAMARVPAPGGLGERWTVTCMDAPGRGFPLAHPIVAGARLSAVHYVQQFTANFCFWTNRGNNSGATGDPADRVYCVGRIAPWSVQGDWAITYPGGTPTLAVVNAHQAAAPVGSRRTLTPAARAQDNNVEVRGPSGITTAFAWDART